MISMTLKKIRSHNDAKDLPGQRRQAPSRGQPLSKAGEHRTYQPPLEEIHTSLLCIKHEQSAKPEQNQRNRPQ